MELIYKILEFPNNMQAPGLGDDAVYYTIGNYVKKEIEDDKEIENDKKTILLQYPVVYLHTWVFGESFHCYIGETIDLTRRTDEHEKSGEDATKWQSSWKEGESRVSYFFSSKEMNKSMSLDIEDCLIRFINTSLEKKGIENITCNGRNNTQNYYSNKDKRNGLLEEIWEVIKKNVFASLDDYFNLKEFLSKEQEVTESEEDASKGDKIEEVVLSKKDILFLDGFNDVKDICGIIKERNYKFTLWPVVYLHIWSDDEGIHIYTGEANEILKRTEEHAGYVTKADWHQKWSNAAKNKKACMIVIGHEQINKSITLDLENMLISYTEILSLLPVNKNIKILTENKRSNEQKQYNNQQLLPKIFEKAVEYLTNDSGNIQAWLSKINNNENINNKVFIPLEQIRKESVFLASTLHKLSEEQQKAKNEILALINQPSTDGKNLVIVKGGWGTGKTVVASSIFFELYNENKEVYFIMNHEQLRAVYTSQAKAEGIASKCDIKDRIKKAADITKEDFTKDIEVAIIDEAHLLREKDIMAKGKQIERIVKKAKTTVLFYDPNQHVEFGTLVNGTGAGLDEYFKETFKDVKVTITDALTVQFRMDCSDRTIEWLKSLTEEGEVSKFPFGQGRYKYSNLDKPDKKINKIEELDENGNTIYKIIVVDKLEDLDALIKQKKEENPPSCIVSTYNYGYAKAESENRKKYPVVSFFLPREDRIYHGWHLTGNDGIWTMGPLIKTCQHWKTSKTRPKDAGKTMNETVAYYEVGAVHDIQGFDLNYAGVIIGESWKYKDGKMMIDLSKQAGPNHQGSGDEDTKKKKKTAVSNELGVLLSRGKKGIVIYAVDEGLRKTLLEVTTAPDQKGTQS